MPSRGLWRLATRWSWLWKGERASAAAAPQRRSRHPQVSVEHNNNALHSTNLSAIVNYYSINCSVFKNSVLFFSAENLSISFNCMTYLWQYL